MIRNATKISNTSAVKVIVKDHRLIVQSSNYWGLFIEITDYYEHEGHEQFIMDSNSVKFLEYLGEVNITHGEDKLYVKGEKYDGYVIAREADLLEKPPQEPNVWYTVPKEIFDILYAVDVSNMELENVVFEEGGAATCSTGASAMAAIEFDIRETIAIRKREIASLSRNEFEIGRADKKVFLKQENMLLAIPEPAKYTSGHIVRNLDWDVKIKIKTKTFTEVMKIAAAAAPSEKVSRALFQLRDGKLQIAVEDAVGKGSVMSYEVMEADGDIEDSFRPLYVMNILRNITSDEIELRYKKDKYMLFVDNNTVHYAGALAK